MLIWGSQLQNRRGHDHHEGEHGSRQAGIVLEPWLRAHKQAAVRANWGWLGTKYQSYIACGAVLIQTVTVCNSSVTTSKRSCKRTIECPRVLAWLSGREVFSLLESTALAATMWYLCAQILSFLRHACWCAGWPPWLPPCWRLLSVLSVKHGFCFALLFYCPPCLQKGCSRGGWKSSTLIILTHEQPAMAFAAAWAILLILRALLSPQLWLMSCQSVRFYGVPTWLKWGFPFFLPAGRHVAIAQKHSPWRVFTTSPVSLSSLMFLIAYSCVLLLADPSSGWL